MLMSDPESLRFSQLLAAAREGSIEARNELLAFTREFVGRNAKVLFPPVLRRRADASDATQEVALDVVKILDQFRGSTKQEFFAWLGAILKNRLQRLLRENRTAQSRSLSREEYELDAPLFAALPENVTPPEARMEYRELCEKLHKVLPAVPAATRQAWIWRSEDVPMAEISRRLNCTEKVVARMLREVRTELKRHGLGPES